MGSSTPGPYEWLRRAGTLVSIPFILGLSPVIGGALGWAVDRWVGTHPIATLVGLVVGFLAGIRESRTLIRRALSDDEPHDGSHDR